MNRLAILLVLVVALTPAVTAQSVHFGGHGNFTTSNIPGPTTAGASSIGDTYGLGIGGGAHLDINLLAFSFRFSGDYIHYSIDQDKFRDAYRPVFGSAVDQMSIEGGGLGIYSLSVNGKMSILPIPIVTPYITGGIGLAWMNRDDATTKIAGATGNTIPGISTSGKTMLNIGAGADFKLGIQLFAEVKYAVIYTEGENSTFIPVTVGITF